MINGSQIDALVIWDEDIRGGAEVVFEMSDVMERWGMRCLVLGWVSSCYTTRIDCVVGEDGNG